MGMYDSRSFIGEILVNIEDRNKEMETVGEKYWCTKQ